MAGEKLVRRALEAVRKPAAAPREGIRAYHGSPHDFDRFDLSKIGTGEGAQAYGHGLYFAGNEDVAKGYAKSVSAAQQSEPRLHFDDEIVYRGQDLNDLTPSQIAAHVVADNDVETAHKLMTEWSNDYYSGPMWKSALQKLQENPEKFANVKWKHGHMYEVGIRANPEQFLDWDKPLREQAPDAIRALQERGIINMDENIGPDAAGVIRPLGWSSNVGSLMGEKLYRRMIKNQMEGMARKPAEAAASRVLNEAGVPGIRYLDAGSRGAGEGSSNYVVFDDRLVDIMKKYGLPVMTAGAGAASMADQPGAAMEAGAEEPREGYDRGGAIAKALRTVRQMMERSQDLPPEQRMMVVHKTRLPALEQYERLGGLPVPSTAVVKTGEPLTNFGDVTLVGNPEILAKPSERNPIFASDVYSPRMPEIQGDKKQFFETYNRYGEPTRRPATIGSLVSNMRGNVRGGENFGATEGAVRAQITPQFRSVAELDAARGRLSQAAYDEARAAMRGRGDELFARIGDLSRNPRIMDFYGDMESAARIMRQYGNQSAEPLAAYMSKRYNMDNDAMADVVRYIRDLRDMPSPYFEGKPQRAVPFTDFSGALIPEGRTARDTADLLNRQGVRNIEFYSPKQDLGGGEAERALSDALIERFPGQQFAEGGEVRDGYDKGGVVKKALKAVADLFGTPEMEKWRGKSVIPSSRVEDRYFTGTSKDKDFANFNVGRHGVWLTKDPAEASMYALQNDSMGYRYGPSGIEKTNTASRVIPVFARAENPYTGELPDFALKQNYKRAQSEWFDQLRSQGHDAWLPENNPNLAVILRDPEQIKSAISNTGEFSGPRIDRAEGGRLLEDEYPTHYLPNVGRQVMADGGTPDDDIRRYEARMADIARQPEDIRSMTHAPSRPMRPIQIEGGLIGKRTLGEAPYDVAGPLSGIAQTAYSLKTLPFYFTPAAPFAAAADFGEAAIDTAKAAREGDYLGAGITGALGVAMPGYAYRKPIGDVVGRALNAIRGNPGAVGAGAAGAAMVAPEDAEAIVPPSVAKGLLTRVSLPKSAMFEAAVGSTPSARIDDGRLLLSLIRGQQPGQAGQPSTRGGVFYLPEGSKDARHYKGRTGTFYGGPSPIMGESAFSNPLFVKGATGGKAPEAAYDELMGKKAYQAMRNEAMSSMPPYYLKDPELREEMIGRFLEKYAPSMVGQEQNILRNSTRGNQLAYALQESAVGDAVRRAGYDSVLGYSTSRATKQPFISEVFDVRERSYPTSGGGYDIWPEYLSPEDRAVGLARELALSPRKAEVP